MFALILLLIIIFAIWYFLFKPKDSAKSTATKKVKREIHTPKLLGISLAILILAFNIFLYGTFIDQPPVIGLAGFNILALVAILVSYKKERLSPLVFSLVGVSAAIGLFLPLRANGFVQSVNSTAMILILLGLIFINSYQSINWAILWLIKHAFGFIPKFFDQIVLLLEGPSSAVKEKSLDLMGVFKTVLLTILVLAFFVGILSQADPVFAEIIKDVKDEAFGRTAISLIIAFFTTLFLTMKIKVKEDDALTLKFFSFRDIFVPVVAVISLFAVFIFVQLRYLFGSHTDLASFGFTYSEYVRKGFLELLSAAFFGSMIAYLVNLKKRVIGKDSQILQLKIINVALIAELFFLLASALKRDIMYVEIYGLTRVRIIGGLFLAWLAGSLTLLLIMTLLKKMKERQLFVSLGAMSVLVLLSLNLVNIDKMVAASKPAHHDYKDYFYINNLSEDAYPAWKESVDSLQARVSFSVEKADLTDIDKSQLAGDKLALISLQEKRAKLFRKYLDEEELVERCEEFKCGGEVTIRKWQFFNKQEKKAFDEIYSNQELYFAKVDKLLSDIRAFQKDKNLSLEKEENRLLKDFNYPFIDISLDYWPESISQIKGSEVTQVGVKKKDFSGSYNNFQIGRMNQSPNKISNLNGLSCNKMQNNYEVVAMLELAYSYSNGSRSYTIWDNSVAGKTRGFNLSDNVGAMPKDVCPEDPDVCSRHFGTVTLKSSRNEFEQSCFVSYEIIGFEEATL